MTEEKKQTYQSETLGLPELKMVWCMPAMMLKMQWQIPFLSTNEGPA